RADRGVARPVSAHDQPTLGLCPALAVPAVEPVRGRRLTFFGIPCPTSRSNVATCECCWGRLSPGVPSRRVPPADRGFRKGSVAPAAVAVLSSADGRRPGHCFA